MMVLGGAAGGRADATCVGAVLILWAVAQDTRFASSAVRTRARISVRLCSTKRLCPLAYTLQPAGRSARSTCGQSTRSSFTINFLPSLEVVGNLHLGRRSASVW